MELTPIGFVCFLAAAIIIARPLRLGFILLAAFVPLQTAAAANLWSVGGLSIICAHVLIGAMVVGLALRPRMAGLAVQNSGRNLAIILFGLFALYAIFSAFMMPRLFEGDVSVYSLERTVKRYIALSPLHPTSGNITQSFYIGVNFMLFAAAAFVMSRANGLKGATHAFNVMTGVHLFFAAVSLFPHLPPAAAILDFVRTANYAINAHHTIAGVPRIIGSYAEPSAFGAMSAGLFAWNFVRFMQTRGLWYFLATVLLLACVAMSLSTTAYATLILLTGVWGMHSLYQTVRRGMTSDHITAMAFGAALLGGFLFMIFFEPFQVFASSIFERLFGVKLQSASGIERAAWNMQSLSNFVQTWGLGVGLGSARASSLAAVLLGNVGIVGAVLYVGFLHRSFARAWPGRWRKQRAPKVVYSQRIFAAARAGALALLFSHLIAGTVLDGGLMFILFAATATAAYAPYPRRKKELIVEPAGGTAQLSFAGPPPRPFAGQLASPSAGGS